MAPPAPLQVMLKTVITSFPCCCGADTGYRKFTAEYHAPVGMHGKEYDVIL